MTFLPILNHATDEESVFRPENLLERAATMYGKERGSIPASCVLDFDGELVPVAKERFGATPCAAWACFHTTLLSIKLDGLEMGLIGGTVGAPFAVLVGEQLLACGCRSIIGYSSAGAISDTLSLPCLVVPDRAIRDEGTSYHYLPPSEWVDAQGTLPAKLLCSAEAVGLPVLQGATWSTDAPYRETRSEVERYRAKGILSVEMEAAALMALAQVKQAEIASLLHVTNALATGKGDFHKGPDDINERILRCCLKALNDEQRNARSEGL